MEIKSVSFIKNPSYDSVNPDKWVGRVEFKSDRGNCSIPLAPEVAEKLLVVLTPVLVEFSQRATAGIAEILTKQLQDKTTLEIEG